MSNAAPSPSMEAWTLAAYGRVEDLQLRSHPLPQPAPGYVTVAVEAAAVNPLDLKVIAGAMQAFMPIAFPFVPGSDVCGRVAALGDGVTDYREGDRVVALTPAFGGFSSHVAVPVGATTAKVSDAVSATDIAALPEAGLTALAVTREAEPLAGRTVAVIGATGGVGLFLCQLLAREGAHVIATAMPDAEELVRTRGAGDVLHYADSDPIQDLRRRHADGVDVLVDLIHEGDGLMSSAHAVKGGGRLISTLMGPAPEQFPNDVDVRYVRLAPEPGDLDRLVRALESRSLLASVTRTFTFARARDALLSLRDGHVQGKIVIEGRP